MNKKRELTTPIRLRQRDKNSHTIHASIFDHGVTYDLSKKNVQFNASKPDGTIIQQSASITDNAIEYTLPEQATAVTGKVKCYFSILDSSGNVVDSTATFYLEVEDAINLTAGSKSYIESIDAIKSNFESKVATINAQLDKVQQDLNNKNISGQEVLDKINKIKSDAENALAKLNSDAQATLSGIDSKITSLVNDKWNTKSTDLDTKYNSHIKELDSSWNTLRDKALQQSNEITNKNNQAGTLINSITTTKKDIENILEKLKTDSATALSNLEKNADSLVAQAIESLPKTVQGVKPDANGNITLPQQTVVSSFDVDSGQATTMQRGYDNYWPVDQMAINQLLREKLPAKYALKSDDAMKIPVVNGGANDDLARFRNMCQLRIYDGNGQNVKSVPFQNNWFSVLVNMHSNWGTLTYLGQDRSIWQSSCNGDQWSGWTKLASTDYIDNKVQNARDITNANTWQDIFGDSVTSKDRLFPFRVATSSYIPNVLGDYASGIAFGKADVKGTIAVSNHEKKVVISGGSAASASPRWSGELSFKDDFANYYNKPEIDNKFKNIVLNIVDFGAKAEDSNFDNAPAFNRAIQSLPSTGGIIYIPNGNFFLKSTVTIDRSYVHIMGLNHGLRSGIDPSDGTTQTGGGGAKVTVQNSISAFKIQNTHNDKRLSGITFSGFDLKGDTNGGVGIDGVSNTDRVVIDNMTINNIGTGVKLNGADAPRITNSWIAETKSSIQLTGASQQAEIKNNSLGAQPQGITVLLENADRYNISGNNIYPDGSSAIRLLNPVHGAIVGNTISAYYTGIIEMLPNDNTYGNSNVISGNVIAIESWKNNPIGRDSKWGIIHIEGYDNLISGNNILANGSPQDTTGILIMKGDRNKIATNVITIPNTSSKVVCNGSANNNTVVYSTDSSSFQNGLNSSNQNIDFDEVNALKKNYAILETQLNVLQGQMADLLGAISISGDTLQINGKLAVRGNVTTYWDGADQFIVYSGHNFKRGYFGMYDNGQFKVNG